MRHLTSHTYGFIMALALAASHLGGCTEDSSKDFRSLDNGEAEVTFSISSAFNSTDALGGGMLAPTRADDGKPVDPENANEKINNWFLVFIDKDNTVRKILHRSDVETKITSTDAVERETFKCILPYGTYSVYAFANISQEDLTSSTILATSDTSTEEGSTSKGVSFSVGSPVNPVNLNKALWKAELNGWDCDNKPIPMTGYLGSVKVQNTIEETFSIEVVRMVAKVELKIQNDAAEDVTINSVSIDPVTSSSVSLFPNGTSTSGISYGFLGNSAYTPVENATYIRFDYTPTEKTESGTSQPLSVAAANEKSVKFYIKESLSSRENNNAFTIWLNVTHKDGASGMEQHNITSDILSYINRNDWIVIPITLSRYDIEVEAKFYPPIGGYPAYLSTLDPDGAQVFTFATGGEFAIIPHVVDKMTGTHLPAQRYKVSIESPVARESAITGDTGIFTTTGQPSVLTTGSTAMPPEIVGELSDVNEGKAIVNIKVDVYDKPYTETGAQVTNTYTRRLYILRDNSANL